MHTDAEMNIRTDVWIKLRQVFAIRETANMVTYWFAGIQKMKNTVERRDVYIYFRQNTITGIQMTVDTTKIEIGDIAQMWIIPIKINHTITINMKIADIETIDII